jgi:Leucine-rich repeat (LRR) protein
MNTVATKEGKQIVSLEELVPQHDCLKLLILHTPYTLLIDTLPLCTNLVKLDLSKNNLETFPHLGSLTALRFMFLHENRLDLNQLKKIFEQHGQPSQLS